MENNKSYELIPGVRVTEQGDTVFATAGRMDVSKFKQFGPVSRENGYSDQEIRTKIGKNNGWSVCSSWSDPKSKQMHFKVVSNSKETKICTVSYEDICKNYGWKSFKWSDDGQMILPTK